MENINRSVYFINGVSWVGKTTVVESLRKNISSKAILFLNFDDVWVPSEADVMSQYGSWEKWQEAIAHEWINKIFGEYKAHETVVIEWQVNARFLIDGFQEHGFKNYTILLITCDDNEIQRRLSERGQGELANENMYNWQRYLITQANTLGIEILDTTTLSKVQVEDVIQEYITKKGDL